jgi:hypothetical protein
MIMKDFERAPRFYIWLSGVATSEPQRRRERQATGFVATGLPKLDMQKWSHEAVDNALNESAALAGARWEPGVKHLLEDVAKLVAAEARRRPRGSAPPSTLM